MRRKALSTLGLLLAFIWAVPATANGGVQPFVAEFTQEVDFGGTCLNEVIRMEFHLVGFEQFVLGPPGAHFRSIGYVTVTATGLGSGYVWTGKGSWPGAGNWTQSGEWTDIMNLTFVPVSDGPMWKLSSRWHYTLDANGELRNYFLVDSLSCLAGSPQ